MGIFGRTLVSFVSWTFTASFADIIVCIVLAYRVLEDSMMSLETSEVWTYELYPLLPFGFAFRRVTNQIDNVRQGHINQ